MTHDIEASVRTFIEDNFLFREDRAELADTESLLESGLIDSTGILELVAFLESGLRHPDGGRRDRAGQSRFDRRASPPIVERKLATAIGGLSRRETERVACASKNSCGRARGAARTRRRWSPASARLTYRGARRRLRPARRDACRQAACSAATASSSSWTIAGRRWSRSSPCSRPARVFSPSTPRPRPTSSPMSSTTAGAAALVTQHKLVARGRRRARRGAVGAAHHRRRRPSAADARRRHALARGARSRGAPAAHRPASTSISRC